jgi:hypothetical protein
MALTPKQRKAALEKGLAVNLAADDDSKYRSPNPKAATQLFSKPAEATQPTDTLPADGRPVVLPADGRPVVLPADGHYRQTVDRKHYRQTGSENGLQDFPSLPSDGRPVADKEPDGSPIPLAPVQWATWEALKEAESTGKLVSYRKLALEVSASIRGVRDALTVIEKEGGIRAKVTVRTPDEQGMRIALNTLKPFRPASLQETKGLLKRGNDYRQTVDRKSVVLPSDGRRLSVCITDYIRQTDVGELLRILPPAWNIRERTLIEIARSFPLMTSLEFRRSLLLLVDQAKKGQTAIQNHNAWLKAAFTKSEGPLVTQRMIEAHLDQLIQVPQLTQSKRYERQEPDEKGQGGAEEIELLRWYLACGTEERAKIDRRAEEKVTPLLAVVAEDKRAGVIEEARLEAIRELVAKMK